MPSEATATQKPARSPDERQKDQQRRLLDAAGPVFAEVGWAPPGPAPEGLEVVVPSGRDAGARAGRCVLPGDQAKALEAAPVLIDMVHKTFA